MNSNVKLSDFKDANVGGAGERRPAWVPLPAPVRMQLWPGPSPSPVRSVFYVVILEAPASSSEREK